MKLPTAKIKKIAVLRALYLGDLLCAVPALRALRHAYPEAEISLVGLPWARRFVDRFQGYVDRFISFPGYPGLPEQVPDEKALLDFLENMRKEDFDVVLQMHGNGTFVNMLVQMFDAGDTAGFYSPKGRDFPSECFIPYPEHIPEIHRHLKLMDSLGIPTQGDYLEFPLTERDHADFMALEMPFSERGYLCIHPGSRSPLRQWPPKYFAAIADYFAARGLAAVITGTREETHLSREVCKYMKHQAYDLTGKTSLGAVALLIKNAYALISNCTGVSHIADAMQTPSVIISMDGEPERWSPLNKELHDVIDWKREPHFGEVFHRMVDFLNTLQKRNCLVV
jgi:ADP-heptose:LPS heptosyltransferase